MLPLLQRELEPQSDLDPLREVGELKPAASMAIPALSLQPYGLACDPLAVRIIGIFCTLSRGL